MTLHMLQMEIRQPGLMRWVHAHGLPDIDDGYIIHRLLRDAFGPLAPQPFRWFPPTKEAQGRLLGYGRHDEANLRDALALAEPLLGTALPATSIASKPLPPGFAAGAVYGFEVRVCPLVRAKKVHGGKDSHESDAFFHYCRTVPDEPLSREEVYSNWLSERLHAGGAETLIARVHRFELAPLVRRRHASTEARRAGAVDDRPKRIGRSQAVRRPDVTFRGTLRVTDPERFRELLTRGVGRHRAFGYGMLMLRPPTPA